jgi:hypothetical protein
MADDRGEVRDALQAAVMYGPGTTWTRQAVGAVRGHRKLGTLALEKHLILNVRCELLLGTPHSEKPFCINERLGLF